MLGVVAMVRTVPGVMGLRIAFGFLWGVVSSFGYFLPRSGSNRRKVPPGGLRLPLADDGSRLRVAPRGSARRARRRPRGCRRRRGRARRSSLVPSPFGIFH